MNAGDICYVDYGEHPTTIHMRLLGSLVTGNTWAIITPDEDIYEELMGPENGDFVNFVYGGPGLGGSVPAGINAAQVYGFRAMTAARYQQLMQQARVYAAGLRAAMGIVAPPAPPIAGGVPAPVIVADEVWVSLENMPPYSAGEVVIPKGNQLPPGHVTLGGGKALIPVPGSQSGLAIKKIKESEVGSFAAKDLRVLPLKFDPQGVRRRDFSDAVAAMSQVEMPGGGLQLDGPSTTLEILKGFSKRSLTPVTDHERWIRSNDITKSDRSVHEMEVIARVIESVQHGGSDQPSLPQGG